MAIMESKPKTIDLTPQSFGQDRMANWWTAPKGELHNHAWEVARQMHQDAAGQRADNLRNARLYSNRAFLSLSHKPSAPTQRPAADAARLTLNVIKSCIDTACAKISQSRPRPSFLTSGGDWKLTRKAKQLTKFMDGLFDAQDVYAKAQQAFRDSLVFGTGILKVYQDGEEVCFERVLRDELLVDEGESFYGMPRQLHQRRFIQREVLAAQFPDKAELISMAQNSFGSEDAANPSLIAVVESWHLRSGPKANDGKRCVTISNATLVEEPYEADCFPFAFLHWSQGLTGFWGIGLAEELTGIQLEINKILRNIQTAQDICSVPRVFVEAGSQVSGAALQANPQGLSVVRYTGAKPEFMTASAMPGEIYSHLDRLVRQAYEITGVSQMSATSRKPSGLDSGVALREYADIESERFMLVGQRWEAFCIELSALAIGQAEDLAEQNPKWNVKVAVGKGKLEHIAWKDVQLEENQYLLRCFPTSLLPTTPAGKLQKVQELMQAGFIGQEEGLALLDFPDLERSMNLNNAAYEDVMQILERIVEAGEYETPEPYMNLQLAVKLGQSKYLRARSEAVPEDRLELLRRFIGDCEALLQPPEPAAPPAPPAAPAQLAVPEAQPQSDLLPVAPPRPAL